tara:strand:- start:73957 stop:74940 length:984 start_codon:yes stop_codon:yes gene_type:complete
MAIREAFWAIAQNFGNAKAETFGEHPLAQFIRKEAADAVAQYVNATELKITGSPGQGNWADVPWVGIFHRDVTTSATHGYYVVYLFSADLKTVNLSFGQGVTQVRNEFGKLTNDELLRRSALIRDRLPSFKRYFAEGPVNLNGSTQLAKDYEQAVAFLKSYDLDALPDEDVLVADLQRMIDLYRTLVDLGGLDNLNGVVEANFDLDDKAEPGTVEEQRRYVRHTRIERRSNASKAAKRVHGYVCQVCGFDFEAVYGELGKEFIEAHHLIPMATLEPGETVNRDPDRDFAVLCANCHRMAHREKEPVAIQDLKSLPGVIVLKAKLQKI